MIQTSAQSQREIVQLHERRQLMQNKLAKQNQLGPLEKEMTAMRPVNAVLEVL